MSEAQETRLTGQITFSSSLEGARWRNRSGGNAFERWHFDALSDDGREALIIAFYDNYPFSPRHLQKEKNGSTSEPGNMVPAVAFTYFADGRVILRAVNEFRTDEIVTPDNGTGFSVANSSFRVEAADYGSGFVLNIDLLTARKARIKAELEWLSVESDLSKENATYDDGLASWNMVAPRSDVSGRITLLGRQGTTKKVIHLRGTGYHDHFRCGRSLCEMIGSRYWGRAHFSDATAIFHHHEEGVGLACSKLFLIRDGKLHERDVAVAGVSARSPYGFRLPDRMSFLSNDKIRLRVKPVKVIHSGSFEATILSEMTLVLRDGKPRKTLGIAKLITPVQTRPRFFRWLAEIRIGRKT